MRLLILVIFVLACAVANAEPSPLEIQKSVKKRSSDKNIRAVHLEIPTNTTDIGTIRHRIVLGMLATKGRAWMFEGEGDGYILARFDYRGNTTVMRIEYNEQLVQLKYHGAIHDFVCVNLVDDICYKNQRGYFNYTKNLRTSIAQQLSNSGGS